MTEQEQSLWDKTAITLLEFNPPSKQTVRNTFNFLINIYGQYTEDENQMSIPCRTFQVLLNQTGLMQKLQLPQYYGIQGFWIAVPVMLEHDYDIKWKWNNNHECENCPERMLCFDEKDSLKHKLYELKEQYIFERIPSSIQESDRQMTSIYSRGM
jgi:hypothetical protein